jgi:hypothetical protein
VGTVLVADDRHHGHPVVADHPPGVVGLAEEGVEPLEHPLGDRRGLAHPHGRAHHEDVGVEDLLPHFRPGVAVALVGGHARADVEVDHPHGLADLGALLAQGVAELAEQDVGARGLGAGLQGAVECDRSKGHGPCVPRGPGSNHPPRTVAVRTWEDCQASGHSSSGRSYRTT